MRITVERMDDINRIARGCQRLACDAYAAAREAQEHGAMGAARFLQREAYGHHGTARLWAATVAQETARLRLTLEILGAWLRWCGEDGRF